MKPLLQTDSSRRRLHLQHFTLRSCQTLTEYRKCSPWYLNNSRFHFNSQNSRLCTSELVHNVSPQMYKTKWSPPLKSYIYLILSISNYPWHIYPDLQIQYTNSSSDSLMNINPRNPLAERTVSDSPELMKTLFFCHRWNRFSFLPFY